MNTSTVTAGFAIALYVAHSLAARPEPPAEKKFFHAVWWFGNLIAFLTPDRWGGSFSPPLISVRPPPPSPGSGDPS